MKLQFWLGMLLLLPSLCLGYTRVAIIGAGPSGIAAAERLLRVPGNEVKVFEKDKRKGGKLYTMPASNGLGVVELGAIQICASYDIVMGYAKAIGEPMRDYWGPYSLRSRVNEKDGNPEAWIQTSGNEYTPWSKMGQIRKEIKIMDEALKHFEPIKQRHMVNVTDYGSEFNMSFEAWADQMHLPLFKEMFRIWITSYGYGRLDEIPAFLPLYAINSSSGQVALLRLSLNQRMFTRGFSSFLNKMIEHYNIPVETDVNITSVVRTEQAQDGIEVNYTQGGESHTEKFDRLIVACGFSCIKNFMSANDMTEDEKYLLGQIYVTPYDTAIASVPGLPKGGYVVPENLKLKTMGHVSLISKNTAGSDDVILYIPSGIERKAEDPVPPRSEESELAMKKSLVQDMERFGYKGTEVKIIQHWDNYFPLFKSTYDYNALNEIQGLNNTLYVGGLARFEYVEPSMKHAIDMVEEHILKIPSQAPDSTWKTVKRILHWQWAAERKGKIDPSFRTKP